MLLCGLDHSSSQHTLCTNNSIYSVNTLIPCVITSTTVRSTVSSLCSRLFRAMQVYSPESESRADITL